jgi:hypothetical protein
MGSLNLREIESAVSSSGRELQRRQSFSSAKRLNLKRFHQQVTFWGQQKIQAKSNANRSKIVFDLLKSLAGD